MVLIASSPCSFLLQSKELEGNGAAALLACNGLRMGINRHLKSPGFRPTAVICASTLKQRSVKAMVSPTTANSAPKREMDPKKRVVITGMGIVSVFGNDVDTFYDKLLEGESGVGLIDRFDVSKFPVQIAAQIRGFSSKGYIDPKNDRRYDNCWRYCLVAGKQAFKDANLVPEVLKSIDRSKIGVVMGSSMGGVTVYSNGVDAYDNGGCKKISPFLIPHLIVNTGSALLAIEVGGMGPNYSISSACATANHCFYAAANHIRRGEAEIILAGGTDAGVVPAGIGGFITSKALSNRNDKPQKASRPWDKDRNGFVLGEGSGVLVMESLEHAKKRGAKIYAEYLGGALTCDAHDVNAPRPDGLGISTCITKGLEDAGVSPYEVNYINAHATSTIKGDIAELNAIKKVFKNTSEMKINATKSMIGHALSAAGGLEAIATIKAITTGWLHPTINQHNLEPEVTIDTVPNVKKKHEVYVGTIKELVSKNLSRKIQMLLEAQYPEKYAAMLVLGRMAMSNSFGFGGQNSVAVFAPFTP